MNPAVNLGLCGALAESAAEVIRVNSVATDETQSACLWHLTNREHEWVRRGAEPSVLLSLRQAAQFWMARGVFGTRTEDEAQLLIARAVRLSALFHKSPIKSLRGMLSDDETSMVDTIRVHPANFLGARAALLEEAEAKAPRKPERLNLTFAERQAAFLADVTEAQNAKLLVDERYVTELAKRHDVPVPGVRR